MTRPPVSERRDEDDRDFGFEYTEAREPNHQEPSYRQRSRRDSYNSDRPTSVVYPEKHIPRSNRDPGPPVSTRGFDTSGRSDNLRHGHRARDEDWADRKSEVRNSSYHPKPPRAEIALHQPSNDGYTPYPEEDTRHRRLRRPGPEDDMLEPQSKPRKLAPENEILELRPKPRKIVPEDEDQEPRSKGRKPPLDEEILDMRTRDAPAEKLDREGDDRPRRHHHKRHHRHGRLDDYDNRKDRDRRVYDEPRDMLDTEDDGPAGDGLLVEAGIAGAAGAAAATGLAAEGARRHRHKESRDEDARPAKVSQNHLREPERERIDTSSVSSGLSGDTGLGEVANEEGRDDRRRRRKMEEEDEDRLYEEARLEERRAKEKAPLFVGPVEPILREQASYERRPETQAPRHHRSYRPRHHHSRTRDEGSYSESSYSSSSDSEDDKIKREPHVVTPPNEDKPTPPPVPKGILRKPREKFPEHPDTVREGVAPHKDAGKKDVPPNARWTKINRKLVNPEALEQDGIRFNEYVDYVIVLKAMDLEEIEKYTRKTQEIREKRRLMAAPENIKHEDSF